MNEPKYLPFIRFIEYEKLEKKIFKYFINGCEFRVDAATSRAQVKRINGFNVDLKIDRQVENATFNLFELTVYNYTLLLHPFSKIRYKESNKDNIVLNFSTSIFDFQIEPIENK